MPATDNHPTDTGPASDNHPTDTGTGPAPPAGAGPNAADRRSAPLLSGGDDDNNGRFAVAEEVSLDQQSDQARRIGTLPPDPAPGANVSEALAATLAPVGSGHTALPRPDGHARSTQRASVDTAQVAQLAPEYTARTLQPAPGGPTQSTQPASVDTANAAQPPPDGTGCAQP